MAKTTYGSGTFHKSPGFIVKLSLDLNLRHTNVEGVASRDCLDQKDIMPARLSITCSGGHNCLMTRLMQEKI